MDECTKRGCRHLQTTCVTCGRVVCEKILPKPQDWISVKDELPSKSFPILVWREYLNFPVSVYWMQDGTYGEPGFFEQGDEYEVKVEDISYWMPLPEPPKE